MTIDVVSDASEDLIELVGRAASGLSTHRGGAAMLTSIVGDQDLEGFLRGVIARNELWAAKVGEKFVGFALCRNRLVEAVYVDKSVRRQGLGTALVKSVSSGVGGPIDAYALPGDRATKSLYESLGWKARLLTMRGE